MLMTGSNSHYIVIQRTSNWPSKNGMWRKEWSCDTRRTKFPQEGGMVEWDIAQSGRGEPFFFLLFAWVFSDPYSCPAPAMKVRMKSLSTDPLSQSVSSCDFFRPEKWSQITLRRTSRHESQTDCENGRAPLLLLLYKAIPSNVFRQQKEIPSMGTAKTAWISLVLKGSFCVAKKGWETHHPTVREVSPWETSIF